jgi:hypothetical protein
MPPDTANRTTTRAIDDPVKLARAARIVRAALARQRLRTEDGAEARAA